MAEYINVKLANGHDIIGVLDYDNEEIVAVSNPIQIDIHPQEGMFARSYLLLSEENTIVFYRAEIMHIAKANKKACEYYEEFVRRLSSAQEEKEVSEDLEEMFTSMIESKVSTKH